jgi:hypothetical protein
MYCSARPSVTRLPFGGCAVAGWCGACHLTLIKYDQLPISNILYNIAIALLFNAIDREAKELLPIVFLQ